MSLSVLRTYNFEWTNRLLGFHWESRIDDSVFVSLYLIEIFHDAAWSCTIISMVLVLPAGLFLTLMSCSRKESLSC